MAFAGKDRKVHLWDVQTRQLLQQFAEHSHEINLLTFSTDGKKLISGSLPTGFPSPNALRNKSELHDFPTIKFIEIKSWDLSGELQPKGKPAERMPIRVAPPGQFASVVVSPNLEQLLVIPGKNDVFLRLDPKAHEREIQEGLEIDRFQSPKGLTIWPLKVGQSKVFILLGKEDPLFPALNSERYSLLPTFSPDGSCLVCDGMFWDARTGNKLLNIDAGIEDEMVFNPEGNLLSTISHHHRLGYGVIIWQARTGTKLLMDLEKRNYFDAKGSIQVRFSPDGKQFVSASRRKRAKDTVTGIKVWSTRTWEEASRFTINSSIRDLGLNPSGSRLLGLCGAEKLAEVKSWDSSTGKELATLCKATSLRFSSDGRYCVTIASPANDQTEITIWDTDSAIKIATLPNMNNRTSVWHLSPDGKTLATSAMDHAISIWNTQTGQELLTLPKQPNPIRCVVFDSSGRSLLTVLDNGTVKRWDVKTGKEADW
jgi:WD40 repeat protein